MFFNKSLDLQCEQGFTTTTPAKNFLDLTLDSNMIYSNELYFNLLLRIE